MNNKTRFLLFAIIEIIIYALIIYGIFSNKFDANIECLIRLTATFVLTVFSVISFDIDNLKPLPLIISTLIILGADYVLLFTELNLLGIGLFIISQILFSMFIFESKKNRIISLISLGSILVISLSACFIFMSHKIDIEGLYYGLSLAYGVYSLFNIIFGSIIVKKEKTYNNKMYLIFGMFFLFLCDICIGLFEITSIYIFNNLEWIFYWFLLVSIYYTITINLKEKEVC